MAAHHRVSFNEEVLVFDDESLGFITDLPTTSSAGIPKPIVKGCGVTPMAVHHRVSSNEEVLVSDDESLGFVTDLPSTSSAGIPKPIAKCCGKAIDECQCSLKENKEDEDPFIGSACSLEEFALTQRVMQIVSTPHILSCLFTDITYENASQEFIKFVSYIRKHSEPGRSELATLIFPVTVHLFALLMQCEGIGVKRAKLFLNRYVDVLYRRTDYEEALAALNLLNDIEELKQHSLFQHYFESKIVIRMAKDVFKSLQNFLKNNKNENDEIETIVASILSLHIEFENSDLYKNEDEEDNDEESSGDCKKNEIDADREKELELQDSNLDEIEITKIVIHAKKPGQCFAIFDLDNEEVCIFEDVSEYAAPKKKQKNIKVNRPRIRPAFLRNLPRNISTRSSAVKPKTKEVKVDPIPKKDIKDPPKSAFKSLHSVDFNSAMTELAYAIGDKFIYSFGTTPPAKKEKKPMNFINDMTVVFQTFEYDESRLKATRNPGNEKVFNVKYLPKEPSKLLVGCTSKVKLFDTKSCTFLDEYDIDSFVYDIDIDSTGEYFATANHDLTAYTYSFYEGRELILIGHEKAVTAVKFHPNGIYIATGSEDCTVRLFELENGNCVRLFVDHVFGVWRMDISYDGHLIATADSSGLVNVWDIKDCAVISKLNMHNNEEIRLINSLCFHENSFILAACIEKGEVKFWDAINPERMHTIRSFKMPVIIKRHKGKGWNIVYTVRAENEEKKAVPICKGVNVPTGGGKNVQKVRRKYVPSHIRKYIPKDIEEYIPTDLEIYIPKNARRGRGRGAARGRGRGARRGRGKGAARGKGRGATRGRGRGATRGRGRGAARCRERVEF